MSRQRTMTRLHRWIATGSAFLLAGAVLVRAPEPRVARLEARPLPQAQVARGQAPIDFARDIQPIFKQVLCRVPRGDEGPSPAAAAHA